MRKNSNIVFGILNQNHCYFIKNFLIYYMLFILGDNYHFCAFSRCLFHKLMTIESLPGDGNEECILSHSARVDAYSSNQLILPIEARFNFSINHSS